ncbi:MAG: alpha/beta hydrolase [Erysipelotrichaceae bacterium]|nr:alpha/beta hydrolase [Erysipelotrichaceae bacterium]
MITNVNGLNIYYEKSGTKGKKVLLLHGWGQNTSMMSFIAESLKKHFIVYNIDFPGFGQSDEPKVAWDTNDYTEFIHDFCLKNKIKNPIIIAHSFGCRIAVRYAYKYSAHKMCLTGAAGIRDKRTIKWYFKTYSYKLGKKILSLKPFEKYREKFESKVGSDDYKNTSGVMKKTFVKVVNEDTTPLLKDIECETLLVFGENDKATPVTKGQLMEKLMPNAALVVFENDDHFAYFNEAIRFVNVLDAFLRSDY